MPANDLEIYERYAQEWWQPEAPRFKSLQRLTPFRLALLRDWIGTLRGKRILDLGCGGGLLSVPLVEAGAHVVGVDRSAASIEQARAQAGGRGEFYVQDLRELQLGLREFDVVLLADVLDHIPDYERVLEAAHQHTREGGVLFAGTINRNWLSKLVTVTLGEGLGYIPAGTHDASLFIRPHELMQKAATVGYELLALQGEWPKLMSTLLAGAIDLRRSNSALIAYSALFRKPKIFPSEPYPMKTMVTAPTVAQRSVALLLGLLCHAAFACAIAAMAYQLFWGFSRPILATTSAYRYYLDALLVLQFPILHSFFLSTRGRALLVAWLPSAIRHDLSSTVYALFASLQLLAVFLLWQPLGAVWYQPQGALWSFSIAAYALAWIFLAKAIADAGMGLQTGFIGWSAVLRGRKPKYPGLPTRGLFRSCRQPIYFGFFLVLITGPVWTLDHLLLALVWGSYCYLGPRFKERRFTQWFGAAFEDYRAHTPYFFPRLWRLWRE